jgi:hypothetical protein
MTSLRVIIRTLEPAPDTSKVLPLGFSNPHSYRGYYDDVAFEPTKNVTINSMLAAARSAVGVTFSGWKGGEYRMNEWTTAWLAVEGSTGETLGPILLGFMLGHAPPGETK